MEWLKGENREYMKLKELLDVLPNSLQINVIHNGWITTSTVYGMKTYEELIQCKVISVKPRFIHSFFDIQTLDIRVTADIREMR